MRNVLFGSAAAGSVVLVFLFLALRGSEPQYQRAMPDEPGGIANSSGGGGDGGGGLSLGGGGGGGGGDGRGSVEGSPGRTANNDATQPENVRPPPPPRETRPPPDGPPPDMTAIGRTVLWTLLAVVVAFFLFWLFILFRRLRLRFKLRRNRPPPKAVAATQTPTEAVAEHDMTAVETAAPTAPTRPLTEWERLAQAGDYGAAVRVMLRAAVARVRHRAASEISPDLTSREIVQAVRNAPETIKPLDTIVRAVEFVHFAGRPATVKEYDACVASLAQIEGGEAQR